MMKAIVATVLGLIAVVAAVPIRSLNDGSTHIIKDTYFKDTISVKTRTEDNKHYFLEGIEYSRHPRENWIADVSQTIADQPKTLPIWKRPGSGSEVGSEVGSGEGSKADKRSNGIMYVLQPQRNKPNNNLPTPKQYVTTHNAQTGKAVFSNAVPVDVKHDSNEEEIMKNTLLYVTDSFPVNLRDDADLAVNAKYRKEPPGLVNRKGSVLRYVDFAPASPAIMHRTVSLDYAVVMEGEVELVLDSGERRLMKKGDVAVQRGTMHAWANKSPDQWARVLFMLQPSVPLEVKGQQYDEAVGGIAP